MRSREVVKRAIEFDKPDRIPLMFPYLGVSDVYFISLNNPTCFRNKFKHSLEQEDEWGTIWEKPGQIQILLNRINEFTMGILENIEKYKGKIDGFYMNRN